MKRENTMKEIKTTDAVGQVLCHDVTQIIRGVTKDAVFRKGHVIREEDISVLLSMGKDHIYIWEKEENMLHENEAALLLYSLCENEHMHPSEVKEGKIEVIASCDGLLKVDRERLNHINALGEMMIASRHGNFPVKAGDKIAGTRIIPLVIEKEKMEQAKAVCGGPIFELKPYLHKKVGIVTTGNEVYHGRIQDTFTPVIKEKLSEYDVELVGHELSDDNHERITACIRRLADQGADLILCTGGMSVDPDDRTPLAIRNTGARIVTYGAPVLPGAMFLLAYLEREEAPVCGDKCKEQKLGSAGDIVIMGLPGCVMYAKRTIFDLALPRIMAGETLEAEDISVLGEGGLCLSCPVCTFPNCGFGKGGA
jgi:molybdenum cofactor synthesis domain-containing protein